MLGTVQGKDNLLANFGESPMPIEGALNLIHARLGFELHVMVTVLLRRKYLLGKYWQRRALCVALNPLDQLESTASMTNIALNFASLSWSSDGNISLHSPC